MPTFTIDDLVVTLRDCAGEDEEINLDGDILDVPFADLGYDSLALLNTAGRIERDCGVKLSDDVFEQASTPRALVAVVNEHLSRTV